MASVLDDGAPVEAALATELVAAPKAAKIVRNAER